MKKLICLSIGIIVCIFNVTAAEELKSSVSKGDYILDTELEFIDAESKPSDCLKVEDSCTVEFLQLIYCELRSYSCFGDAWPLEFSWGKTASIHSEVLGSFIAPEKLPEEDIPQWIKREAKPKAKTLVEFIDHEAVEHLICKLEGEEICLDGSLYKAANQGANCSKYPKTCGSSN